MDPVSQLLVDRERSQPRLLPWIIIAVLLHAGAAAATYLVGKRSASRPIQLPVVAVKLVRPQAPSRRPPSREPQRRSSPVPQATKPPATAVPKPAVVPTAPPRPRPEEPKASDDAMRSADSAATPAPTPPPSEEPQGGGGPGLSVGESNTGGGAPGIPSDFHFTYYVQRMLTLIESRWYKPAVTPGTSARVRFVILKDGRVEGIQLEESSGMPSFDRAALRAMYAANPLPPLPPAYGKPSLTVHLNFTE